MAGRRTWTLDPKPALATFGPAAERRALQKTKGSGFMPSPFGFASTARAASKLRDAAESRAIIDDCCIIRSMHTTCRTTSRAARDAHRQSQPIRPSLGRGFYGLGTENENCPATVLRPSPKIVVGPALWSNSFLPAEYQATSVSPRTWQWTNCSRIPQRGSPPTSSASNRSARAAQRAASRAARHEPAPKAKSARWKPPSTCSAKPWKRSTSAANRNPSARLMARRRSAFVLLSRRCWKAACASSRLLHERGQSAVGHAHESQRASPEALRRCGSRLRRAHRRPQATWDARRHAGRVGRGIRTHTLCGREGKKQGRTRSPSHRLFHAARRGRRARWPRLRRDR